MFSAPQAIPIPQDAPPANSAPNPFAPIAPGETSVGGFPVTEAAGADDSRFPPMGIGQDATSAFPPVGEDSPFGRTPDPIEDENDLASDDDKARRGPSYTWLHYIILFVVALVLGLLIWLLIDNGSEQPATQGAPVGTVVTSLSANDPSDLSPRNGAL